MIRDAGNYDSRVKGMYLRTLMTNSTIYGDLIGQILKGTGNLILSWINERIKIELDTDEESRMKATIMKALQDMGWFDPNNPG